MNRLAELILKKSLNECTTDELLRITERYPYFNAGHLLAVAKTNNEGSSHTKNIFQKASLHFHPVQLSALINKSGNVVVTGREPVQAVMNPPVADAIMEKQPEITIVQETVSVNEAVTIAEPANQIVVEEVHAEVKDQSTPVTIEKFVADQPVSGDQQPVTSNEQPATSNQPQAADEIQIAFEPYHTVDYFASQGIKVKLEDNPPDKFSKQLRSFTEWLKAMKKLPDAGANIPPNITSEKKVEHLAENSLTDSNVITEAMAEVWVKQGHPEKAIEIYHKLSLLEPSKSPYFASRISAIKNN